MSDLKKTLNPKELSQRLGKDIRENVEKYYGLKEEGGSDPFWADGVNMNLCRNHILNDRKRIEAELNPEEYPQEYYLEIPPIAYDGYMAKADEIRFKARKTLEALKANEDFLYLRSMLPQATKDTEKCMNPVRYILGYEEAVKKDDLVAMRRCQDSEYYVQFLRESRKKLDEILKMGVSESKIREGQLTIWDFMGG